LDIDSVGLLVLTQDGRVARQLIGEDSDLEKEYLVRVQYVGEGQNPAQRGYLKDFPDHEWDAKPSSNVAKTNPTSAQALFPAAKLALLRHGLSLDGQALRPAGVEWQNPDQLRFVLKEGKKRQIRRMCELVGLSVVGLKRIRMGQVSLGALPTGQWRYLGAHERF
jgi:23S rRNA pseudouridine2604 synthase